MTNRELALRIAELVGGTDNISSAINCMTRLRLSLKDSSLAAIEDIKSSEGVLGVVEGETLHIILGPGRAKKVADELNSVLRSDGGDISLDWEQNKKKHKSSQKQSKIRDGLKNVGDIFVPLIPGIIAAGLCAGFATLIAAFVPDYAEIRWLFVVHTLLSLVNVAFMTYITAWAGYRAAEKFGGTPILGGMLGMITTLSGVDSISKVLGLYAEDPLNSVLRAGRGGVLAVILGVWLLCLIEKGVGKFVPDSLAVVVTPVVTLILSLLPYLFLIMPLTGYISAWLVSGLEFVVMSESLILRCVAGFAAALLFLPMVSVGMHHGLVAMYAIQLETLGYVTLYPALAMAGAGQVGAAIAIYFKARSCGNKRLCSVITGALPAGVMGVGEPLIYGVTLPLGKPFLTAGIGAGFGGAFVMATGVASTTWGPSGLPAIFIMTAGEGGGVMSIVNYGIGLGISYIMGFVITRLFINTKDVSLK